MATSQTLIDRALRLLGAIASGESPTSAESSDGLVALNAMLSSWQTEKLTVYAFVDTAFNLAIADNSYTVGPSGNFAITPRPVKLEQVYIRASNIDYPVELIDREKWISIPDKTSQSDIAIYAYYEPTLSTGTLQLWPVPNKVYSLHIITWTSVLELAALSTTVTLPPGYERALTYNLAVEIAPEYEKTPNESVVQIARESKAAIQRANIRPMLASSELSQLTRGQRSNIYSGGYVA